MEKDDLFTYPDKKSVSTSFITNFTDKDLISIQKTAKRKCSSDICYSVFPAP